MSRCCSDGPFFSPLGHACRSPTRATQRRIADAAGKATPAPAIRCPSLPVHAAQVLESIHLDHELVELNAMAQADGVPVVEPEPYILDIDLDYVHSEKAIEPDDPATLYRLIQNAVAVTVATELSYVADLRCEGSKVTGASLLERMKQHVQTAMT